MTREQIKQVLSDNGYTLSDEWDGVSEEVPVCYFVSYNYLYDREVEGTAKLSMIEAFYNDHYNPVGQPD